MINVIATMLIMSILFIAFNTFAVFHLKNKMKYMRSMIKEINNNDLESKIARVKSDAQPLVDKYKQEQRQKHWEQYNHWENDIDRLGNKKCFKCLGENLSILTFYDNDYPVQAEFHCDDCYCCINKWEYKEDNQ